MGYTDNQDEQFPVLNLPDQPAIIDPSAPKSVQISAQGFAKAAGVASGNAGLNVAGDSLLRDEVQPGELTSGQLRKLRGPGRA